MSFKILPSRSLAFSHKSHLLNTKIISLQPKSPKIRKCSTLWAFKPSFISTTKRHTLKANAPLIIVLTRFSCPGTSMKAMFASPPLKCEKLSSIVIPLCLSSASVSPSKPFKAFISELLPWSMCPAVPMMSEFIGFCLCLSLRIFFSFFCHFICVVWISFFVNFSVFACEFCLKFWIFYEF